MSQSASTFQRVGVIGAGQMGAGIAQVFAVAGTPVPLFDSNAAAVTTIRIIPLEASTLKNS